MKVTFLYTGPHPAHAEWAKSVNARFVSDIPRINVRNISRFLKTLTVSRRIPKDTDILLCESGASIVSGYLWKKKNPKKKLVLIVDDPKLFFLPKLSKLKQKVYLKALKSFDLFVATTPMMKSFVPREFRSKVRVVQLYVDYNRFYQKKPKLGSKTIVFVGLVGKEKGVDKILQVFKQIGKKHPDSKLYIVGEGILKEKSSKNIIFTGHDPKPEKYLRNGSIYINLGRIEPFGIAILEAMSAGLVPIVAEGVGVKYAVKEVSPALVVKNGKGAYEIMEKLLSNEKLRENYSKKSQKIAKEFTKEKSIKLFRKVMVSLLK